MPALKLTKLPDRTPVRITITVSPALNRALGQYAECYRDTYGQAEMVADLIPFMLEGFLDSDRGFVKARKDGEFDRSAGEGQPHRPKRSSVEAPSTTSREG